MRLGPEGTGSITGLFTVLVEDDHNEPISDSVRGIIDGHIVLERSIADKEHSLSTSQRGVRMMPDCNTVDENLVVSKARSLLASYEEMADMIRLELQKGERPKN